MVHAEKAFTAARDPIDLYAVAGASYRVLDSLRVGAEYVVQDIEGVWNPKKPKAGSVTSPAQIWRGPTTRSCS